MVNSSIINESKIPNYVTHVTEIIEKANFEVFLVGGCVRDLITKREPKDWDITTNAKPEEIISLFEKTVYENIYGTVGVCLPFIETNTENNDNSLNIEKKVTCETNNGVTQETSSKNNPKNIKYNIVEVTPYRTEAKYEDFRHPTEVTFSKNIGDDLKRRDFTINALAYSISKRHIIDLYKGQVDIKDRLIRAVGNPNNRFKEDALRMLRAVRFAVQLNFVIENTTMQAIVNNASLLKNISNERIRDEFIKIIESDRSALGVGMLSKLGLLKYIIPELEDGIGCNQGGAHIFDVFEHCLQALEHTSNKKFPLKIRLSALFHDIGKPFSKRQPISCKGQKPKKPTFYGHEVVGARMAKKIMNRLKFPKNITDFVVSMVRNHMFFSDTEQISLSAVRRIVKKVGKDHIWELMQVREADRVGMKKKEAPYRLRKYHAMIEEVLHDPISVGQLKINGEILIKELSISPGPKMGWILNALLEEILDDPTLNTKKNLVNMVAALDKLQDNELEKLGKRGIKKKEKLEEEEIGKLHMKHRV